MRILILANIPPYAKGGAETQARFLAEEFVALGHEVTVAGHEIPDGISPDTFSFKTVPVPVWRKNRVSRALSYFISLAYYLLANRKNFDIIYCRFLGEAALSVCMLKQLFKLDIPLVPCTACAGKDGDAERVKNLPFYRSIVSVINRQCNAINNISPKIGEELADLGINPDLFRFFPNGIRLKDPKLKTTLSTPRKLVFLGRLAPQKAVPVLLDAIASLFKRKKQLELHLIGDGPDREMLEAYARSLQLEDQVFFHGHIDNDNIVEHLSHYDIFVLSSLCEGFATAVIEAMFAGLPAVVTISGGPDYFVDDQVGRLCPPGDSDALANALQELIDMDDDSLLALGRAGQQRVMERFDIRKIARDYTRLFDELCS